MEFQRATDTWGITHLVDQLRARHQRPVVQLIRRLRPIGCKEAIEVALTSHGLVQQRDLRVVRLGELQATGLPVAPAAAAGQVLGQALGQFVSFFPTTQTQQ